MAQDPLSHVASWLTPTETPTAGDPLPAAAEPSTSGAAHPDDSRVLLLFREWVETTRADRWDLDNDALAERADDIEREINSLPAIGAADLAIKMYLYIHAKDEGWRADHAALSGCEEWELKHRDTDPRWPLVREILSFVPELYPLVTNYATPILDYGSDEKIYSDTGSREATPR
jgi:hypothetical protein